MKKRTIQIIACFCLIALLLAGCSEQETGPGAMGSKVWEEMPKLTYGVLETDHLEVLSWDSGRCEASVNNLMAETEKGYYLKRGSYLYYADKANLSNWIVVCNRPDCDHVDWTQYCSAKYLTTNVIVKDNRIFYLEQFGHYLYPHEGAGLIIASMAADGADRRVEYVIEEAIVSGTGNIGTVFTQEHWLLLTCSLNKDGSYLNRLFRVTATGEQEITLSSDCQQEGILYYENSLLGEDAFVCNLLGDADASYYRFINNKLEKVNLQGLDLTGSYLSGNTLRVFQSNDGYYDIDLTTREEVFLTPARLENSMGYIFLPNCIIESTLFMDEGRKEDITHSMEMFDGEKWRVVKLPSNLVNAGVSESLFVRGITSNEVILTLENNALDDYITPVYRIALDSEELVMEYCGEIVEPHDEEIE